MIDNIDELDEHGWNLSLDDWEKNHNGAQYKSKFLNKRDTQRNETRNKEQEIEDKQYWETHPEELAETKKIKKKFLKLENKFK